MNTFAKDDFLSEYSSVLSNYSKDYLSHKEHTMAHMPSRVLETILLGFYSLSLSSEADNLRDGSVLSCTNPQDLEKVVEVIEATSAIFATKYGKELYGIFLDEMRKKEFRHIVIPEFIMPSIVAISAYYMLIPSIQDSDRLVNNKVKIDFKRK